MIRVHTPPGSYSNAKCESGLTTLATDIRISFGGGESKSTLASAAQIECCRTTRRNHFDSMHSSFDDDDGSGSTTWCLGGWLLSGPLRLRHHRSHQRRVGGETSALGNAGTTARRRSGTTPRALMTPHTRWPGSGGEPSTQLPGRPGGFITAAPMAHARPP